MLCTRRCLSPGHFHPLLFPLWGCPAAVSSLAEHEPRCLGANKMPVSLEPAPGWMLSAQRHPGAGFLQQPQDLNLVSTPSWSFLQFLSLRGWQYRNSNNIWGGGNTAKVPDLALLPGWLSLLSSVLCPQDPAPESSRAVTQSSIPSSRRLSL